MAFPLLLAAFILVPIIEITVLIKVGSVIGIASTIVVVIFTAILGAYLVRQQGFATLQSVQKEMNEGRVPALQMAEGIALLFAGALLLTPGFVTDGVGFALLTPPIRRAIIAWVSQQGMFKAQTVYSSTTVYSTGQEPNREPGSAGAIEGEFSERD